MSERPKWNGDIDIELFERIDAGVVSASLRVRYYDADKMEDWVELKLQDGGKVRQPKTAFTYFKYNPNYLSLFSLTYTGEKARDRAEAIREWEEEHEADIKGYERLAKKLGAGNA